MHQKQHDIFRITLRISDIRLFQPVDADLKHFSERNKHLASNFPNYSVIFPFPALSLSGAFSSVSAASEAASDLFRA